MLACTRDKIIDNLTCIQEITIGNKLFVRKHLNLVFTNPNHVHKFTQNLLNLQHKLQTLREANFILRDLAGENEGIP